jgi:hypothetical protein
LQVYDRNLTELVANATKAKQAKQAKAASSEDGSQPEAPPMITVG